MSSCAGDTVNIPKIDVSKHDTGPLLGAAVLLARAHQDLRRWAFESNQAEPVEPLLEEIRAALCVIGGYLYRFRLFDVALVGTPKEQVYGIGNLRQMVKGMDQDFGWLVRGEYTLQALATVPQFAGHATWSQLDAGIEKLARVMAQRAIEAEPIMGG